MKKRFSDEQIISILREAEAGVSARELCRARHFTCLPRKTYIEYCLAAWRQGSFLVSSDPLGGNSEMI